MNVNARPAWSAVLLGMLLSLAVLPEIDAAEPGGTSTKKVYGEWRIRVKPDKGKDYDALIAERGLPLFREAGGRMVGWWKTLIGDLYEHVTIWEYDDIAAFERAGGFLGGDKRFAEFVALRDPLLAGEESRFLKLTETSEPPPLPIHSKFLIHENHRVPQGKLAQYLDYMREDGIELLKQNGFRPVGPWTVDVGNWSEVTYLFLFDSLDERSRLMAEFAKRPEAARFGEAVGEHVGQVVTRVLMPAPFAAGSKTAAADRQPHSALLPHLEEVGEGVFAAGFSNEFNSANCGWARMDKSTLLIDLPRGVELGPYVSLVEQETGKPIRKLALTSFQNGDETAIAALLDHGVDEIVTSPIVRDQLTSVWPASKRAPIRAVESSASVGDSALPVEITPIDAVLSQGGAAIFLPTRGVLFAGALVFNGPRTPVEEGDTELWISKLRELEDLRPARVVPGFGSWGDGRILGRERRFLAELRRQVGYAVAQARPESSLASEVRIPAGDQVWMPYDNPTPGDLQYVYRELTVPVAPFHGRLPADSDPRPHALVLFGDLPHEPGHIEETLRPILEQSGVVAHFTVDVRALSADNLAKVKLLVILRDGLQRPSDDPASHYVWMTPEQQKAVEAFVTGGGAFLNLHNSMGLYPDEGEYLKLVGGRYIGHGPLERFRVEVVDAGHPITRGIEDFSVADEQHTPPYDADKVHLLLRNRSDDGKVVAAAGWAYEPGRGRLCHLANGHTRESLEHPTYRKLISNAIDWCLRRESN